MSITHLLKSKDTHHSVRMTLTGLQLKICSLTRKKALFVFVWTYSFNPVNLVHSVLVFRGRSGGFEWVLRLMELATKTLIQYESPAWYARQCQLVLSLSTLAFSNIVVPCPIGQLDKLVLMFFVCVSHHGGSRAPYILAGFCVPG